MPLGKVLRVEPNLSGGFTTPSDNPFDGATPATTRSGTTACATRGAPRSTARNGTLWIADVGQGTWEEINREPATSVAGVNYGWDCREGAARLREHRLSRPRRSPRRWPGMATVTATARSPAASCIAAAYSST